MPWTYSAKYHVIPGEDIRPSRISTEHVVESGFKKVSLFSLDENARVPEYVYASRPEIMFDCGDMITWDDSSQANLHFTAGIERLYYIVLCMMACLLLH